MPLRPAVHQGHRPLVGDVRGAAHALDDDVGPELAADVDEQPLGEGLDADVGDTPARKCALDEPDPLLDGERAGLGGVVQDATTSSSCSAAARSMTSRCPEVTGS